jgi:SAM-dependent methyltransferase
MGKAIRSTWAQLSLRAIPALSPRRRVRANLPGCRHPEVAARARFLKELGAQHVYAVDHDQKMIDQALSRRLDGVTFLHVDGPIPLPDASIDGAVSMNVFIEIRTLGEMTRACAQIARVLRRDAPFVLESSSPMAFGHTFRSYSYPHAGPLRSGETTPCIVTTPGGQFVIQDTYWTEDDYVSLSSGPTWPWPRSAIPAA